MTTQSSAELVQPPALLLEASDPHNDADRRNEDEAITPVSQITGSDLIDEQDDPNSLPLPFCTRADYSDSDPNSPWSRKMILTLDGGGIKGYSSLLILKRIMFLVGEIELGRRPLWNKLHSDEENGTCTPNKSSADYPWYTKPVADNKPDTIADEETPEAIAASVNETFKQHTTQFKPHHYFDYVVGTSTGGLSATMLARMEMSIDRAIDQYDVVGDTVFGKPRFLHSTIAATNYLRPKYQSRRMIKAIQEVIKNGLAEEMSQWGTSTQNVPFESNPRRCRTIAVAHGPAVNSAIIHAYLFRSYDHLHPSPLSSVKYNEKHLNPGRAHRDPIWQVARATSAAPKYFSSISFGDRTFRDGGMVANNPSKLALNEVWQMHEQPPRLLLSIGTGTPEDLTAGQPEFSQRRVSYIKDWFNVIELLKTLATQSERTHQDLESELDKLDSKSKVQYFRFNVEGGVRDVVLDQWEPRKGGKATKDKMLNLTKQYLSQQDVNERMLECARELVQVRRRRAETDRWEQFAREFVYYCTEDSCKKISRTFETREALRQHSYDAHSFVWDVRVKNHCELQHACFWDQCQHHGVNVFKRREEYLTHLHDYHKIGDPRFKTRRELENWLDKGRKDKKDAPEFIKLNRERTRTQVSTARINSTTVNGSANG
ncbi:FabD/lysophospholipase-like protein [Glonium stellatum]|uniref:FabD/lysophospholipase-like protein n=1 Tax=Glonium stellatum TaxID=574774 RepID=A0A8E2EV33_9PEZI|nr:FabD/lysophospholipase-like protein [Glonium stellatum]